MYILIKNQEGENVNNPRLKSRACSGKSTL